MGLDNIPHKYACLSTGEDPILVENKHIDCEAMIEANRCPYMNMRKSDPRVKDIPLTLGILGTPCWFRGKVGNGLLSYLDQIDVFPPLDFYGKNDEGFLPEEALLLSKWMANNTELFASVVRNDQDYQYLLDTWVSATWWLDFVGKYCEGADAWF